MDRARVLLHDYCRSAGLGMKLKLQIPSPLCWQSPLCRDNGTDDFQWPVKIIKVMTNYWRSYGSNCWLLICFHLGASLRDARPQVWILTFITFMTTKTVWKAQFSKKKTLEMFNMHVQQPSIIKVVLYARVSSSVQAFPWLVVQLLNSHSECLNWNKHVVQLTLPVQNDCKKESGEASWVLPRKKIRKKMFPHMRAFQVFCL